MILHNNKRPSAAHSRTSAFPWRRGCRTLAICLAIGAAAPYALAQALLPGTATGWGFNGEGRATVPAGLTGVKAIAAGGTHSLALKTDGMVVGWGYNGEGRASAPAGLTGVKAIAAGDYHSLALKADGTVVVWGNNDFDQTTMPAGLAGVKAIVAGGVHSLALKTDGTVVGWGFNGDGQATVPAGLTGVKAVAAGLLHSLALKTDGTVVAWGYNGDGQATVPAGLTGVKAIVAGAYHSLALKTDGTVAGWGYNGNGQTTAPAGLTGVNAISAGGFHSLAANVLTESALSPYTFVGFLAPVNNPGAVNVGKAGRTYPLKWQLKDKDGTFVTSMEAVESLTYKPAQCGSFASALTDGMKAQDLGTRPLSIEAGSHQYHYNWATPSTPGCYALQLTLKTGQVQQAYFNLR